MVQTNIQFGWCDVKNKHKRQFLNTYKWYDYSFLLMAMEDWLDNASKVTMKKGMHLNADRVAKRMRILAELARRIREESLQTNKVFTCRNFNGYDGDVFEKYDYRHKRTEANLKMFTDMLNKHLLGFWD
jgi:hypothetical protein